VNGLLVVNILQDFFLCFGVDSLMEVCEVILGSIFGRLLMSWGGATATTMT